MPANYPDIEEVAGSLDVSSATAGGNCNSILASLNEAFDSYPNIEEFGLILSEKGSNIHEYVASATDSRETGEEFGNGSIYVIGNKMALAIWSLPHILREANQEMRALSLDPKCER